MQQAETQPVVQSPTRGVRKDVTAKTKFWHVVFVSILSLFLLVLFVASAKLAGVEVGPGSQLPYRFPVWASITLSLCIAASAAVITGIIMQQRRDRKLDAVQAESILFARQVADRQKPLSETAVQARLREAVDQATEARDRHWRAQIAALTNATPLSLEQQYALAERALLQMFEPRRLGQEASFAEIASAYAEVKRLISLMGEDDQRTEDRQKVALEIMTGRADSTELMLRMQTQVELLTQLVVALTNRPPQQFVPIRVPILEQATMRVPISAGTARPGRRNSLN